MTIEAKTVRQHPTGSVRADWSESTGTQRVNVSVDPRRNNPDSEFSVVLDRRWGHQIGDVRTQDFRLSRRGAETLRDALTAALEWRADQ